MRVELRMKRADASGALQRHIQRRLRLALTQFAGDAGLISARISENPGRGLACRLTADLGPFGRLSVEDSSFDVVRAIDGAVGKLRRALMREQERNRAVTVSRESIRLAA